ncbi:hypothetical protein ABPG74_022625 [Tetrahymena malaccensis]
MMKVELNDKKQILSKKENGTAFQSQGKQQIPSFLGIKQKKELDLSGEIDKILGGVKTARTGINFVRQDNNQLKRNNSLENQTNFPQIKMQSASPKRENSHNLVNAEKGVVYKFKQKDLSPKSRQIAPEKSQQNMVQDDQKEENFQQKTKSKKQQTDNNQNSEMIKRVTNLSNVIYILGSYSNNLLEILEHHDDKEKYTLELINKMKSKEFLSSQKDRVVNINKLYEKFFIETLIKDGPSKEVNKEIAQIIGQEIQTIIEYYDQYIDNQEEQLRKFNTFQDKEIILITDFQEALKVLMDTYNYYFKELEVFGKSKQDYNVYIKSLYQFKSILKTDPRNEKVCKLFEDLEDLLKSNYEKIDNALIKIGKLNKENEELTKICQELQEQRSQFLHKMLTIQTEKQGTESNQQDQKQNSINSQNSSIRILEDYYTQTIENLKQENKRLNEQIQKQSKKIQLYNNMFKDNNNNASQNANGNMLNSVNQNQKDKADMGTSAHNTSGIQNKNTQQDDIKNKIKQYYTADKQIQCTFIVEKNPVQKKENDITHIIIQPIIYLKSATVQSKEWTLMVTNAVFSDKFLSDIMDENDLRPCIPMNIYVCEWFLKKFGNKDVAESLMKGFIQLYKNQQMNNIFIQDYLISLKKYGKQNERFKIFCEVCGLDELLEQDQDNTSYLYNNTAYAVQIGYIFTYESVLILNFVLLGINRQRFKKTYMRTQETVTILQKIAYLVRMTNKNYYGQNQYLPLFPNILQRCLDLVSNDYSLRIWETIAQEENLYKLDLSALESKFKRIVQQDVIQRTNDPLGVYTGTQQEQEDSYIRFDTLCRCILETMVDQRFFELEGVYSSLKLKSNPRFECLIGFQDFTKIVSKVLPKKRVTTEKTPLNVAVMRLIPFLVNDDCIKQNFLKIKAPKAIQELVSRTDKFEMTDESKKDDNKGKQKSITSMNTVKNPSKTGNSIMGNILNKNGQQSTTKPANNTSNNNNSTTIFDPQIEQQKFKERLTSLYDTVSQLALLEETYKMMYPLIKQLEKKNQSLLALHTNIKEDFLTLPGSVVKQIKYEQFEEKTKEDMIFAIESSWEKFRKILAFITK